MNKFNAFVGENGELIFPEEFGLNCGLKPDAQVCVEETAKSLRLRLPITHLKKVYVEPTNGCNLDCSTCMRKAWDEPLGLMSKGTFSGIINGLKELRRLGHTRDKVKVLEGGLMQWDAKGYPMVKQKLPE
jgi:hypothetical protein